MKAVSKAFTQGHEKHIVLKDISFHLEKGEFLSVLGRSGSGKSTLLDLVMGLIKPDSGQIERCEPAPTISYVFQQAALLPWRTVWQNVALPLQVASLSRKERELRVDAALKRVGMDYAAALHPFQLSGGMAQRVAIARALVSEPELILMDEPFSALDPLLRENLNVNLLKLFQKTHKSFLFVTHSIDEAVFLSDRILVIEDGALVQEFVIDLPKPRSFQTFESPDFTRWVRQIRACLPYQPNEPRVVPRDAQEAI